MKLFLTDNSRAAHSAVGCTVVNVSSKLLRICEAVNIIVNSHDEDYRPFFNISTYIRIDRRIDQWLQRPEFSLSRDVGNIQTQVRPGL